MKLRPLFIILIKRLKNTSELTIVLFPLLIEGITSYHNILNLYFVKFIIVTQIKVTRILVNAVGNSSENAYKGVVILISKSSAKWRGNHST